MKIPDLEKKEINLEIQNNKNSNDKRKLYIHRINNNYKSLFAFDLQSIPQNMPLTKSNKLLALIEIASQCLLLKKNCTPDSRYFWHQVINGKITRFIFKKYNENILRTIWKKFEHLQDFNHIIYLINFAAPAINSSAIK